MIGGESRRPIETARSDYSKARAREEALARKLQEMKEEMKENALAASAASVRQQELERELQESRAAYEAFLVKARDAGGRASNTLKA